MAKARKTATQAKESAATVGYEAEHDRCCGSSGMFFAFMSHNGTRQGPFHNCRSSSNAFFVFMYARKEAGLSSDDRRHAVIGVKPARHRGTALWPRRARGHDRSGELRARGEPWPRARGRAAGVRAADPRIPRRAEAWSARRQTPARRAAHQPELDRATRVRARDGRLRACATLGNCRCPGRS